VNARNIAAYEGAASINRNTFAGFISKQLNAYVASNCLAAWVHVGLDFWSNPVYQAQLTKNQTPVATQPPSGATVLQYAYTSTAYDQAGLNGDIGRLRLTTSFTLSVDFIGDSIVVTQHQTVTLYLRHLANSITGNIIDIAITDSYTISIDDMGNLQSALAKSTKTDNSQNPKANPFIEFFTHLNDFFNAIEASIQGVYKTDLTDLPLSGSQGFIFPGGNTFTFADARFSDYQDLVAAICYVAPSAVYRSSPLSIQATIGAAQRNFNSLQN
jgi:hypothetical protein